VQRWVKSCFQKPLTENRCGTTIEAPPTTVLISETQKPLMWNRGSTR